MRKSSKKKGQGTEMIGLLVIIILLIVLVVMYMKFASKPKSTITETSRASVTSSNLLNAMMLYSVCHGKDFQDAIKECGNGGGQICGKPSCEIVQREGKGILSTTLKGEMEGQSMIFTIDDVSTEPPRQILRIPDEKELKCTKKVCTNQQISLTKIKVNLCRCLS